MSVVTIQRMWRGYKTRQMVNYKQKIIKIRAATRIQRWFRRLPTTHRDLFMISTRFSLKSAETRFFIKLKDYLAMNEICSRRRMKFMQQNIQMVYNNKYKEISFKWQNTASTRTVSNFIIENQKIKKPLFSKMYQKDCLGVQLSELHG